MPLLTNLINLFLHLDKTLGDVIVRFGSWSYLLLFAVIFCETGFVVTPFLPGDSLLFAAGTFAALGAFDPILLIILLCVAAIVGDTINYWVGRTLGVRFLQSRVARFFRIKQEHVEKTQRFYEKHGGKTIILARFVPIVRTFAPFVAGVGRMNYGRFIAYNITGGIAWVLLFISAGYFFGNLPFVKKNFTLAIFTIIFVSILPGIIEYLKTKRSKTTIIDDRL